MNRHSDNFHVVKIGRLIVLVLPDFDWVTIILPYPFNGTKQVSGTLDYVISVLKESKKLQKNNKNV
jgi:hypothetical protein